MTAKSPVRVVSITSGKGGVGKSNITVNLAMSLAEAGRRVMIMDADLGLANIDILFGFQRQFDLSHVITGEKQLKDVIVRLPNGIEVVPASSGVSRMGDLSPAEHAMLIRAFGDLATDTEFLLIDAAAGIHDSVITFSKASQEIIVVVCDEPTSVTDAYALIKVLSTEHGVRKFQILANMVQDANQGKSLFSRLAHVTDHYLDVALGYLGYVPFDEMLRRAVRRQIPVVQAYPQSAAAMAFRKLSRELASRPQTPAATGYLEFFVERNVLAATSNRGWTNE